MYLNGAAALRKMIQDIVRYILYMFCLVRQPHQLRIKALRFDIL